MDNTIPKPLNEEEVKNIFCADRHTGSSADVTAREVENGIWSAYFTGVRGGSGTLIGPDRKTLIVSCPTGEGFYECFNQHVQMYKDGKRLSWDELKKTWDTPQA